MVLLDTNLFIIDRFFPRDPHYTVNREFLDHLPDLDAGFSLFSLLELCGIASFNLNATELKRWSYHFDQVYHVQILEPLDLGEGLARDWLTSFLRDVFDLYARKMTWGDAVLLHTAESHHADTIVTWNKKHFTNRTSIPVLTPDQYLTTHLTAPL